MKGGSGKGAHGGQATRGTNKSVGPHRNPGIRYGGVTPTNGYRPSCLTDSGGEKGRATDPNADKVRKSPGNP